MKVKAVTGVHNDRSLSSRFSRCDSCHKRYRGSVAMDQVKPLRIYYPLQLSVCLDVLRTERASRKTNVVDIYSVILYTFRIFAGSLNVRIVHIIKIARDMNLASEGIVKKIDVFFVKPFDKRDNAGNYQYFFHIQLSDDVPILSIISIITFRNLFVNRYNIYKCIR